MNRENKPLFLYTFITVFGGLIVGIWQVFPEPFLSYRNNSCWMIWLWDWW